MINNIETTQFAETIDLQAQEIERLKRFIRAFSDFDNTSNHNAFDDNGGCPFCGARYHTTSDKLGNTYTRYQHDEGCFFTQARIILGEDV